MGQKASPIAIRVGYIHDWRSKWYADKTQFAKNVIEDKKIRDLIRKNYKQAAISKIFVERLTDKIKVIVHTGRPGVIIGRRGADIDRLRNMLSKLTNQEVVVDPKEVKNPSVEADLVAQNVAFQLEKRVAFRRAMKRAMDAAMAAGAKGIKIQCSGRLNGVEMARQETYRQGKIPLQTLRADIDYGFAEALTTYGILGVKVWIYKGEIIRRINKEQAVRKTQKQPTPQS